MKPKKGTPKPREFYGWVKCVDATLPGSVFPPCPGGGICSCDVSIRSADRPPLVAAVKSAHALAGEHYPAGVSECCDVVSLKLKADAHRHGRWDVDGSYVGSAATPIEVLQFVGSRQAAVAWFNTADGQAWRSNAISVALLKFRTPGGAPKRGHAAAPMPASGSASASTICPPFPQSSWGADFKVHLTESSVLFDKAALQRLLTDAKALLKAPDIDECEAVKAATAQQPQRLTAIRLRRTDMSALMYVVDPSGLVINKPHTMDLLDRVRQGLLRPIFELKAHYARGRPWACCADVPTAIRQDEAQFPWHPAFPAGHATFVYAIAALMGDAVPGMQPGLDQRAKEVADDRVIGGFHWPSDNEAGKQLADLIMTRLRQSSEIRQLLADVRTEWP